jgi:tetratricopeptide (TPR) repeat protein
MSHIIDQVLSFHEPAKAILRNADEPVLGLLSSFNMSRRLYYQAYSLSYAQDIHPSHLDSSIQAWRKALRSSQDRYPSEFASKQLAVFLSARAEARLKTDNPSGAVADWEESFELDQDKAIAADQLISYYLQKEDYALAKLWAEKALTRYPKDAYALAVVGDLAMREQKFVEAEHHFRMGIISTPRDPVFHWKLGMTLALQGRNSEAEAKLKKLISDFPSLADPKIVLAHVLLDQGRNNEAEKYLKAARKIAPQNPMLKQLEKIVPK